MDVHRITPRLVFVGTLLSLGAISCNANAQESSERITDTPRSELLEWFSGPSSIESVISTSDQSNFLKSTAFGSQAETQSPQAPTPPIPPGVSVNPQVPAAPGLSGHSMTPPAINSPTPYPTAPVEQLPMDATQGGVGLPPAIVPPPAAVETPVPADPVQLTPSAATPTPGLLASPFESQSQAPASNGVVGGYCQGGCSTGQCSTGGCGPCNTQSCFEPSLCDQPCSGWTASVGALFLTRNNPNRLPMFIDTTTPTRRMDASNFNFGMQTGLEASVTKHRALGNWDYEFRYFGIDDWDSLQSLRFDGSPIQINNNPPTFISGPRRAVSRYSSELQNFEWNLKRQIADSTRFVFGFRHLQLNEQLATRFRSLAVPAISTEDYVVNTRNRLYGLQVGFDRTLAGGACYCLEAYGRLGAYANDSRQRSQLINYLDTVRTFTTEDRDTGFSLVNEVGLRTRYRLCKNANFVAGYRGLWVNDVALASDQISQTNFAGGSNLDNSGRAFYHGGTIGLEVRF
jgi:hypothetical protein